jgi:CubicO group peptidase (beta-lactamase class C family)
MKKIKLSLLVLFANAIFGLNLTSQNSKLLGIDTFILDQMESHHVPGLSAAIVVGDSVVWHNCYGYLNLPDSIPVNDSTLFNVFSIGKSLTAACAMQIWDDGLLGLDENVNGFLPFEIDNPYIEPDSITARMLMCHTAAISDYGIEDLILPGDPTISLGYYLENYLSVGGEYYHSQNFYNSQPGLYLHYCTHGPALTGYLVEVLTGIDFHLYAKDYLLTPLEMSRSTWFLSELNIDNLAIGYKYQLGNYIARPHRGHPAYPGFFLRSNALELANYVIMLLNHGAFNGQTILSNSAVDSMATIQVPYAQGYGLGLYTREDFGDRLVWGHNGGSIGGYAAQFYFCKEENSGVVLTTNSEQYLDELVEYMFDCADSLTTHIQVPQSFAFNVHITPNPVSKNCMLEFELSEPSPVSIQIFNSIGKNVSSCFGEALPENQVLPTGKHTIQWNTAQLREGIYFCRLQIWNEVLVKKIIKN